MWLLGTPLLTACLFWRSGKIALRIFHHIHLTLFAMLNSKQKWNSFLCKYPFRRQVSAMKPYICAIRIFWTVIAIEIIVRCICICVNMNTLNYANIIALVTSATASHISITLAKCSEILIFTVNFKMSIMNNSHSLIHNRGQYFNFFCNQGCACRWPGNILCLDIC